MDTQLAQLLAASDLRSKYRKSLALKLLHRYAIVELNMLVDAKQFALNFERKPVIEETDKPELDRFFTWYYINYIIGPKNGLLKIETVVNYSFFKFLELPQEPDQKYLFESYAREELSINNDSAVKYADSMVGKMETQADDNFCLWFYINYVVKREQLGATPFG